jgi:hypothetical protein
LPKLSTNWQLVFGACRFNRELQAELGSAVTLNHQLAF